MLYPIDSFLLINTICADIQGRILRNIHKYIKHKSKTATVVKLRFFGFYQKSLPSRNRKQSRKLELAQFNVSEIKMVQRGGFFFKLMGVLEGEYGS